MFWKELLCDLHSFKRVTIDYCLVLKLSRLWLLVVVAPASCCVVESLETSLVGGVGELCPLGLQ